MMRRHVPDGLRKGFGMGLLVLVLVACGVKSPPQWTPKAAVAPSVTELKASKSDGLWQLHWSIAPSAQLRAFEIHCQETGSTNDACPGCPVPWTRMGQVPADTGRTAYDFTLLKNRPVRACRVVPVIGSSAIVSGASEITMSRTGNEP